MGKAAPDATIDAMFDYIDQSNIQHVCSAEPANYAGIAAVSLADVAMTVNTDYTKANGDTSGRKATVAAKSGVTVGTTGTATHVVLANSVDSTLRYVTTCTSQALTAGNTVNIPAWDIEVADPT
ncbi:MAG: hypothetical protein ACREQA_19595 [Candidatus Binatia bacterium]